MKIEKYILKVNDLFVAKVNLDGTYSLTPMVTMAKIYITKNQALSDMLKLGTRNSFEELSLKKI